MMTSGECFLRYSFNKCKGQLSKNQTGEAILKKHEKNRKGLIIVAL